MGVEEGQLYGRRKVREVSEARSLASKWLVEDLGMTVTDVGRILKVTHAAVVYGARRGREVEAAKRAKLTN
jgi:predicted transcriptional regulator